MKFTKDDLRKIMLQSQRQGRRLEAAKARRKNVAHQDKRSKRNRTRQSQNHKAIQDQ